MTMAMPDAQLSSNHQAILDRFLMACQADQRVIAAFLVGSYAKGKADEHSDLDLYIVTRDDALDDFAANRKPFVRLLGEPAFVEDFDAPGIVFLIFPDGSEVEINYASQSRLEGIFDAPFKTLLDKRDITAGLVSRAEREFDQAPQTERLRRLIQWFWHNFSHFVTALARNQLWWAQGQLDILRANCVGLARLRNGFSDPEVEEEVYFKIEDAMPVEQLSPLQDTFCPMEKDAMLASAFVIVDFYRELATALAQEHGIPYPEALEKVMIERLKKIRDNH
jgi:predicted nucleotidyltransferase